MNETIAEILQLSPNRELFQSIREGKKPQGATVATELRPEMITSGTVIRDWLLSGDTDRLQQQIASADFNARVRLLGELILALDSFRAGQRDIDPLLEFCFRLILDLAKEVEALQPQDGDDEELLYHGIALREWAFALADMYQSRNQTGHRAEMLMVRARATNSTLSMWPQLVGAGMVDVAIALDQIGKREMAVQCCNGVRMDLGYLVDRIHDPNLPEFEKQSALYWLHRATEEIVRMSPGDLRANQELQKLQQLFRENAIIMTPSRLRFGPIARTYLEETPYLARIIREIQAATAPESAFELTVALCQKFGCLSSDVEFYISAMGSYFIRSGLTGAGATMMYDEYHEEVFAAIEYLKRME